MTSFLIPNMKVWFLSECWNAIGGKWIFLNWEKKKLYLKVMEDFSCFLLVLWLCRLHVGLHPSHFNFPYAVRPGKAPSLAQPGAKPGDFAWPLPSAGPELCPVFLSWNCWKLWDDFRDFLRLIFSLHSSYSPNSGNDVKGNQLYVWGPLCVF